MYANACDESDNNDRYSSVQTFNTGTWGLYQNPDNVFEHYYAGIRAANHFLEGTQDLNYDHFKKSDPARFEYYTKRLLEFKVEVRFLRAFYYFELIKRYGGVPIITEILNVGEDMDLPRSSYLECVKFIAREINAILPLLSIDPVDKMTGRVTFGTAYALKCRLFLYAASPLNNNGSYNLELCDSSARAFAQLYKLGKYNLSNKYSDVFLNQTSINKEIIFDRRTAKSNTLEKLNYPLSGLPQYAFNTGSAATCPSQNLVDAYEMNDGSKFDWSNPVHAANPYANRDPRLKMSILTNGDVWNGAIIQAYDGGVDGIGFNNTTTTGYYLKKFVVEKLNLRDNITAAHVLHIFRYGELLLAFAEVMNEAHGPDGLIADCPISARDAINLVRSRVGVNMPAIKDVNKADFRERVRNERRVELAFEGHRFWDVRRWMIAATTENALLRGMRITLESGRLVYNPNYVVEERVFKAPAMYRYPIMQNEIVKYKNLKQDENWVAIK